MSRKKIDPAFGFWLRDLRLARGLSQARVAEQARARSPLKEAWFNRVYLHEVEVGKKGPPSILKLTVLAAIYEIPLKEMLARAGRSKQIPESLKEAAANIRYLDPAVRLVEEEAIAQRLKLSRRLKARLIEVTRRHLREQIGMLRRTQEVPHERAEGT